MVSLQSRLNEVARGCRGWSTCGRWDAAECGWFGWARIWAELVAGLRRCAGCWRPACVGAARSARSGQLLRLRRRQQTEPVRRAGCRSSAGCGADDLGVAVEGAAGRED